MKFFAALTLLAISLSSAFAHAQIRLPSYDNLCQYDEGMCSKAVTRVDGKTVVKRPQPELMDYYKLPGMHALIIRIADQYGVDPVTLVAAPLAENTMNVQIKRKLEKDLAGSEDQLDDDGVPTNPAVRMFVNRPLSIGPGQIYVSVAKHVEPLAAAIEGRPLREKKDIKHQLLTPEGALRYAAAILRDAQDTYAKGGVDISRRPEILATLYNIGKVKERLSNARGRESAPNYFGWFVGMNYKFIQTDLNLPSVLDHAK